MDDLDENLISPISNLPKEITMFLQMLSIEQKKLSRRTMLWVEVGIMALIMVGMNLLLYAVSQTSLSQSAAIEVEGATSVTSQIVWPGGVSNSLGIATGMATFLLVILTGALTAQEYQWNSYQLLLSRGVPRPVVLIAKFLVIIVAGLLLVVTALLAGAGITALFSQSLNGTIPFAELNWGRVALGTLLAAYSLLPYAALTFLLAVLTRSAVASIGVGLAYTTLIESLAMQGLAFLGGSWATVAQYLPAGLTQSLSAVGNRVAVSAPVADLSGMLSPERAAMAIALYTLIFVGLAIMAFRRQDLSE